MILAQSGSRGCCFVSGRYLESMVVSQIRVGTGDRCCWWCVAGAGFVVEGCVLERFVDEVEETSDEFRFLALVVAVPFPDRVE